MFRDIAPDEGVGTTCPAQNKYLCGPSLVPPESHSILESLDHIEDDRAGAGSFDNADHARGDLASDVRIPATTIRPVFVNRTQVAGQERTRAGVDMVSLLLIAGDVLLPDLRRRQAQSAGQSLDLPAAHGNDVVAATGGAIAAVDLRLGLSPDLLGNAVDMALTMRTEHLEEGAELPVFVLTLPGKMSDFLRVFFHRLPNQANAF